MYRKYRSFTAQIFADIQTFQIPVYALSIYNTYTDMLTSEQNRDKDTYGIYRTNYIRATLLHKRRSRK